MLFEERNPSADPMMMSNTADDKGEMSRVRRPRFISATSDEMACCCTAPPAAPATPGSPDTACSAATASTIATADSDMSIESQDSLFTNIEDNYHIEQKVIGTGHQGSVRKCHNLTTGQPFAVKSIRKSDPATKPGQLRREVMLLDEMSQRPHSNIIKLVDVYEDEEYVHLVTELYGGELFDKIVEKASNEDGCFSEYEAAKILHQLLSAVSYMHQRNIVHRDIKPENIIFETNDEDSPIKIIDFGLARKQAESPMKTIVGTPYYIAPEVLHKSYTKSCDLWSIGVIAYILMCGYPPFNGTTNNEVYDAVKKGMYWFPSRDWKHVSSEAKDFIRRLLQLDPRKRMTAEEAMRHPWITSQLQRQPCWAKEANEEESSVEVVFNNDEHSILFG